MLWGSTGLGIWVSWLDRTGHLNLLDRTCQTGLNPDLFFKTFYHINKQKKIMKKFLKKKFWKKNLNYFLLFLRVQSPGRKKTMSLFCDTYASSACAISRGIHKESKVHGVLNIFIFGLAYHHLIGLHSVSGMHAYLSSFNCKNS